MTETTRKLATEIVRSWRADRVNYIIVSPPMSAPERLFDLLADSCFICSMEASLGPTVAVARLARANFSSEAKFVAELARQWNIHLDNELDSIEQLAYLTREVIRSNRVPVLLIERFHEAMERLGEEFGTALRDLDKALCLKTVVDLPVSLKMLKLRWDANPGKAPFLNSDWGQGHTEKILKGYTRHEVSNIVKERRGTEEAANFLFDATGGLPELVDRLIVNIGDMDLRSYQHWVRSQATALCHRLVQWLDSPGALIYTRLVAQSLSRAHPRHGQTSLADHPWKAILLDSDGKTGCIALAWASLDRLANEYDAKFIAALIAAVRDGHTVEAIAQLTALANDANPNSEVWKALELLCRFHDAADPYSADRWDQAAKYLTNLNTLAQRTKSDEISAVARQLSEWAVVTQLMSDFLKAKSTGRIGTLEQFVCTNPSDTKTIALLMLLHLRLKRACQLTPYHAMKAVIEQPESLLQIYCQLKLDVCWWNFFGMDETVASQINKALSKPYSPPKKGQTLRFFDMLCISLAARDNIPNEERLVPDETELRRFEVLYKDRNEKVHSAAFVSQSDWNEYLSYCRELLCRLRLALMGKNESIELPEPLDCFSQLIESLIPATKP